MKTTQHRSTKPSPMRSHGFTLIETAIVVAIMGLVATIAVPSIITQLPTRQLNQAVWELNAQIRMARTQAMSTGHDMEITYDPDNESFNFWCDEDGDGLRDVNEKTSISLDTSRGMRVFAYPYSAVGYFKPDGSFSVDASYSYAGGNMLIYLESAGSKLHYWLYVRPTGQVTVQKAVYQYETT